MDPIHAAGGYGPPGSGGGWGPPGGGYGAPPAPPAPPGGGYGSPPGSPPAGGFGGGAPLAGSPPAIGFVPPGDLGSDVNTTMPLLLNVLSLILCGASVINAPLSILGIVFAIQAKNAKGIGDVITARSKTRQSMFFFAGSIFLGVLLFLVIWQFLTPAGPPLPPPQQHP